MKKRLNINLYQLLALIVIVFTVISCSEKIFDEQNGEKITPDQHYKSIIDANSSLMGAVVPLQKAIPNLILIDGLRSDQMITNTNADPFLKDINDHNLSSGNPFLNSSDYYKVIINTNEAIANFHKIAEVDREFDEFFLKYTKGALVSLRSWTYLNLVRLYGKAALIEDNLSTLPENRNQLILTKEVMIDTLINQLLPYIPSAEELAQKVELRVGGYMNAKAVLGELYLEKGDFANAVKYLKLALESYGNVNTMYKVDQFSNEGWKSLFNNSESASTENISVVPFNQQEGQFNPLPKYFLASDQFSVKPSEPLVNSFRAQIPLKGNPGDVYRGFGVADAAGIATGSTLDSTSTGVVYINKYSINKTEPFSSDIIISRAADLHLLLAEALNRSGDSKNALILLNAGFKGEKSVPAAYNRWNKNLGIRGRAYLMSHVVPDSITVIDGADTTKVLLEGEERTRYIEDLIIDERALELAFEGKRWFDLVRIANRRQDPSYLANKVAAKFDVSEQDAIRQKLMNPETWYLPFSKENN